MASGFWKPEPVSYRQFREENDYQEEEHGSIVAAAAIAAQRRAPFAQQRMLLPIHKHKTQILYALENYGVVVIVGETGSGKSTQIPQYLVESGGWAGNDFQVVCTQPRRIAAITLAERVANETGTELGEKVGYAVRFDENASPYCQIKYITDGLLLREATSSDPLLSRYSVVMVDEAHERSLNSDAVLGILKKIRRKRKDLRIIVCSATIDAQSFLEFFVGKVRTSDGDAVGGVKKRKRRWDNNPHHETNKEGQQSTAANDRGTIISVDGRQYPVDILHLEKAASDYVEEIVEVVWQIHKRGEDGDILCFLPSAEQIDNAIRFAEEHFYQHKDREAVEFLPLYGNLPFHMQTRVFESAASAKSKSNTNATKIRRIVFATNIAETSVTVPNIRHVVDSGLVKLPYFDPKTGLERLIVCPISQASARQRAGRAGRVDSGKCYRLYTEKYLTKEMHSHTPPEILRTNITSFILTLKALGVDNVLNFDLMDVPSVDALSHGLESLYALGAIDDKIHLTKAGMDMAAFPTEPRVSRMLLESLTEGCSWEILAVASALQVRDLLLRPRGNSQRQQQLMLDYEEAVSEVADPSGDHVTYANIFAEMDDRAFDEDECKARFINYLAVRRGMEIRNQLARFLRKFGRVQAIGLSSADGDAASVRSRAIRRCVTAGFFFNIAKLANDGRYYTLRKHILVTASSGSVFTTHASPAAVSSEYIVFGETFDGARGGIELRGVSSIEARWLRELAPHYWE